MMVCVAEEDLSQKHKVDRGGELIDYYSLLIMLVLCVKVLTWTCALQTTVTATSYLGNTPVFSTMR